MITLEHDRLMFRFPEVHEHAVCAIDFQRTLRIPDDGADYPLPPGLGRFPLRHLDDYAERLPSDWLKRGGVIMPMHQAEALWIHFDAGGWRTGGYPFALKIATGKVCAITGESWVNHLNTDPQDYVVLPKQPWLDGYCVEKGTVRQFVAMPLGEGYTVEEQLTGAADHGGIQIIACPMKKERYEELLRKRVEEEARREEIHACYAVPDAMGLAPGGRMKQEVYADPYGLDAWDQRHASRCFVTIANSKQWVAITEERPPILSPTAADYTRAGLPWFDYYGADAAALEGAEKLGKLVSVTAKGKQLGDMPLPDNESVRVERIVGLRRLGTNRVREISSM